MCCLFGHYDCVNFFANFFLKCDERHPTCFNCDKSKRVCLGYDPIFRVTHDRRQAKKLEQARADKKGSSSTTESPKNEQRVVVKTEETFGVPVNSKELASKSTAITRSPSLSMENGTGNTTPITPEVPYEDSRDKMNISSLLDAAAVIGDDGNGKRKIGVALGGEDAASSSSNSKKQQIEEVYRKSRPAMEDEICNNWDQVEQNFTERLAHFLDELVGTTRFTRMSIIGKAKASGLPLDGNGTVAISGSSSSNFAGSRSGSAEGDDDSPVSGASNNSIIIVGQNIATLEAIRQLMLTFCPNYNLDNLSIDEGSVGKLEELRTSNDFRLLRAVAQLVTSRRQTEILSVSEKDQEILDRIQSLHRFIAGCNPVDPQANKDGNNRQKLQIPDSVEEAQNKMREVSRIIHNGLNNAVNDELWRILIYIGNTRPDGYLFTKEQEEVFLKFVSSELDDATTMRVPLVLGAHYYLLSRRAQPYLVQGMDANLRMLLLEACSSQSNNVVTRRLVNMILS